MTHTVRLPKGWTQTTLGEFGRWSSGGTPSRSRPEYFGGNTPWIKTGDLQDCLITSAPESVTESGLKNSSAKLFPVGTLLIAMYGATIGKLGLLGVEASTNQACAALLPDECIHESIPYVFYYLMSVRRDLKNAGKGGAQPNISQTVIKKLPMPIAPPQEQLRIVEAIDSYLTRLDDAVASLERVQRNLERYRASVLKVAVEGRLVPTEAQLARQEGRSYEPASELLERILAERKTRWIEDAAEKARTKAEAKALKAGVSWTPEDNAKALAKARKAAEAKYKEPEAPGLSAFQTQAGTTDLPTLPEGWCYLSVDQFNTGEPNAVRRGPFGSTLRKEFFVPSGIKVYEQQHAINRDFTLGRYYVTQEKFESLRSFETKPGDIIMSCSGTIGKTAIVPESAEPGIINQALLKLSLDQRIILNRYFEIVFAALLRRAVAEEARGTGMQNLAGIKELKQLAFPVPPTPEQERILLEFERLDSAIYSWASAIEAAIKRSQRLRQSILKWAFEGKLVEQNPNDEPASALLERIKASSTKKNGGRSAR